MKKNRFNADFVLRGVNVAVFLLLSLICVYPFYYVILYSVSDPNLANQAFLLPKGFTLNTYQALLASNDIFSALMVSIARTVLGTILTVLCSTFLAYLVSKDEMKFRKIVYRYIIITMYVSAGIIPWYITMKMYRLKNNFLLYVLPSAVNAYYIILLKTYIESLPKELEESAAMDGAGYLKRFAAIVLPLSKPIVATVAIYAAVNQWNSWSDNYFLVMDEKLQTLQMILYNYLQNAVSLSMASTQQMSDMGGAAARITPMSIKMCITVLTTLPIMLVYPFLQKYFAKGIMIGAVKG
jgi:ABC-type glycerol-3-phosphate transport system permease component